MESLSAQKSRQAYHTEDGAHASCNANGGLCALALSPSALELSPTETVAGWSGGAMDRRPGANAGTKCHTCSRARELRTLLFFCEARSRSDV